MELEHFASSLLDAMPSVATEEAWWLRPDLLPRAPDELHARELVAYVGTHIYAPDFALRQSWIYATPRACGSLAMVMLAQVLHRGPERVRVHLDEREAALDEPPLAQPRLPEQLLLDLPHELCGGASPELSVHAYRHEPTTLQRWPWASALPANSYDLPTLWLTRLDGNTGGHRDEDRALLGFGSLAGTLRMASLLLDAAQPAATVDEVNLEGEPGIRGVAPTSHEIRLIRPGGFLWSTMLHQPFRDRLAR